MNSYKKMNKMNKINEILKNNRNQLCGKVEEKLRRLAYIDSLTELPNRASLEEKIDSILLETQGKNKKLGFLVLDIDNFKHINDILGLELGDKLIIYIANILSYQIKSPNMVFRLSGDEFVIIFSDTEDKTEIESKIKNLQYYLRRPWILEQQEFFVSSSIGAAIYPEHGENLTTLMQNANMALSDVKEKGKDGFAFYKSDMRDKTLNYILLSNQLRNAIINNEFTLYYQPQYDLLSSNYSFIGVEALIRWNHPSGGLVLPVEFIPFAEKTGFINEISSWVFETACQQKRIWTEKGYSDIKVSVNLSGERLLNPNLVQGIQNIIGKYNVEPAKIELEITESALIDDIEKAIKILRKLRKLGISIALDDFGQKFSSLTYLHKLPIDILKADKEFLKGIKNENDESYILKCIVELAHNLGKKVVSEGVETKVQLEYLKKIGCDYAQGYYFSEPMPVDQIEDVYKLI